MSGEQSKLRASERTGPTQDSEAIIGGDGVAHKYRRRWIPKTDGRATDVEIAHLQKMVRDLESGFKNLHALRPRPHDYDRRCAEQGAKLRSAEAKIFTLRQLRLL